MKPSEGAVSTRRPWPSVRRWRWSESDGLPPHRRDRHRDPGHRCPRSAT